MGKIPLKQDCVCFQRNWCVSNSIASDKQKHKVVMCLHDTVLSLDFIKIIERISAQFKNKFPVFSLVRLDPVVQEETCLVQ